MQETETPSAYAESNPSIGVPMGLYQFTLIYVLTCGLYPFYWAYQNFKSLKVPTKDKVGQIASGIFLFITMSTLLKSFEQRAIAANHPMTFNSTYLGHAYTLACIYPLIPFNVFLPLSLISVAIAAGFFIPLYVQHRINVLNRAVHPYAWGLKPYTTAQKILFAVITIAIPCLFAAWIFFIARSIRAF